MKVTEELEKAEISATLEHPDKWSMFNLIALLIIKFQIIELLMLPFLLY